VLTDLLTEADAFDNVSVVDDEDAVLCDGRNKVVIGIRARSRCPQECRGHRGSRDTKTLHHEVGSLSVSSNVVVSEAINCEWPTCCGRAHAGPLNLQGRKKSTRDHGAGISGFYRKEFTGTEEEDDRVVGHGEVLVVRRIVPDTRGKMEIPRFLLSR
jgi:hypothetical protein